MTDIEKLNRALRSLSREYGGIGVAMRAALLLNDWEKDYMRRYLAGEVDENNEEISEPVQNGTGLPQELRGVIHELTRKYHPNLVVDAAMLEMPEEHRWKVARAFLPKKTFREKIAEATAVRSQLVVRASGRVLYEQLGEYCGPRNLLITEDDETSARYTADANGVQGGTVEHEIKADGSRVIRTYYRPVVAG